MLSQIESELLLDMDKEFEDKSSIQIKSERTKIQKKILSIHSKDEFILDIDRNSINLSKIKYQSRHKRTNTILLRIDTAGGGRHLNPDGEFIPCPHIHIYKEGYGDKWAYPLDENIFTDPSNPSQLLQDFLTYFNVKKIPVIMSLGSLI
ncbi:DUF6978 family protein [Clostridium culturomicium]|uniref:DUF6978 family protein n=1 Tax=Clostridium culturomicium TaxID=1499683 RepID=UPI00385759B6